MCKASPAIPVGLGCLTRLLLILWQIKFLGESCPAVLWQWGSFPCTHAWVGAMPVIPELCNCKPPT